MITYNNIKVSPDYSGLRMATPDGYSGLLRMATPDGYSGWLLSMATPDGYSGWLLRMATPDGYSGWLLRMATAATGVLGTFPKGQPGLGETTYKTSCLPCAGSFSLYDCRIRAGFPNIQRRGVPPHAGMWPALSGHTTITRSHFNS